MNGRNRFQPGGLAAAKKKHQMLERRRRCPIRSGATGRRCTLERHHLADHQRRARSGRILETWPRSPLDSDHVATCTSAELIAHLTDLIDLAKWEGYGAIVGALERAKREIAGFTYVHARRRRERPASLFGVDHGARRDRSPSRT